MEDIIKDNMAFYSITKRHKDEVKSQLGEIIDKSNVLEVKLGDSLKVADHWIDAIDKKGNFLDIKIRAYFDSKEL